MHSRALAFLPLVLVSVAHAADPDLAQLRKDIAAAQKASPVVGLSVAIVKDGKLIFAEGFGYADKERHRKATADTVYDIGSVTKSFTALLAAQSAQEGKLSLKDKPTKYLPAFTLKDKSAAEKITLEDMLSHRSGLNRTDLAMVAGDFTRDELMQLAAQSEATAPIGTRWQYQNLMYAFMGSVLEKANGASYDAQLKERVFRPLGMNHSASTYAETKIEPRLATGYSGAGLPLKIRNIDPVAPAGSISSSAVDMAKYVQMLLSSGQFDGKQVISKEAIEETRKPRIEMQPGTGQFYGLGWMMTTDDGVKRLFHGGNIDGFTANVVLVPEKGIGIVALSNGDGAALPTQVTSLILNTLAPKKTEATTGPFTEALPGELGRYRLSAPPVDIEFVREGKRTFMVQNGQKIPLELVGPKRYTIQKVVYLTFGEPAGDGKKGVKLEQAGMKFTLLPAEPYKSPVSAEEVLAMQVKARGGADVLRRHSRYEVRYRVLMPNEALSAYGIRYRRDAMSQADFSVFYGLDRRFATVLDGTDGQTAFTTASFMAPSVKRGRAASDAVLGADLFADLEPKRAYKSIAVVREDKVGTEPVWVLEKTSPAGSKTTDFVSKADGKILKRSSGSGAQAQTETFSDFRNVDGLIVPFKTVSVSALGSRSIEEILSIRFDEAIPEWPFKY